MPEREREREKVGGGKTTDDGPGWVLAAVFFFSSEALFSCTIVILFLCLQLPPLFFFLCSYFAAPLTSPPSHPFEYIYTRTHVNVYFNLYSPIVLSVFFF